MRPCRWQFAAFCSPRRIAREVQPQCESSTLNELIRGRPLIVSNPAREEILASILAGIPTVAQAIAAGPARYWSRALDAARRSYAQSAKEVGFAEADADIWLSAVMFQLRLELKKALAKRRLSDLVAQEPSDARSLARGYMNGSVDAGARASGQESEAQAVRRNYIERKQR